MQNLLKRKKIIICAGSGGVGKTTIAASIACFSASKGYRTFVLTIDPSYRLKTALGFDENSHKKQIHHIKTKAPLFVSVLQPQAVFDHFIKRHCKTEESFRKLKNNIIYKELSTRLGFYQEFTALLEVYEAFHSEEFDKIILDTPPGPQFMNFLKGSEIMSPLFEKRLIKWLTQASYQQSFFSKLFFQGPILFMNLVKRFAGHPFVESLYEFMTELSEIKEPILSCLSHIETLLLSSHTAYVGVVGEEGRLFDIKRAYDVLILNRLAPFELDLSLDRVCEQIEALKPPLSQKLKSFFLQKARCLYQKRDKYAKIFKGKVYWVFDEEQEKRPEDFLKKIMLQWEEL